MRHAHCYMVTRKKWNVPERLYRNMNESDCKSDSKDRTHTRPQPELWLRSYPWEDIVWTVAGYWRLRPEEIDACVARETRDLWQREAAGMQTLCGALRLCRECQAARAFGKYECESFVIVARDVVKPYLGQMSATLAAAIITIIADYVRDAGDEVEMQRAVDLIMQRYVPAVSQSASPAGL